MTNSKKYSNKTSLFRLGIVGGGEGSFVGPIHRMVIQLTEQALLVAGAPEEDPSRAQSTGEKIRLSRTYGTYQEMLREEQQLPPNDRIECVIVATPNNFHYKIAKSFINAGIPVICEKPFTLNLREAQDLAEIVKRTETPLMITHNYSGYPLVKEAKKLIKDGMLGEIRQIFTNYIQGWLLPPLASSRMKQISWRLDPKIAGLSTCLTDIGSHAEQLTRYISGLSIDSVCADLTRSEGRILDDSAAILVRYANGAKGIYNISQTSAGEENDLHIRIYGTKAGLEWKQMEPNTLLLKRNGRPTEIIRAGTSYLSTEAKLNTRLPAGHPEAFIEAFTNLYLNFFKLLRNRRAEKSKYQKGVDFPTADDGVKTMAFIEASVESDRKRQSWIKLRA